MHSALLIQTIFAPAMTSSISLHPDPAITLMDLPLGKHQQQFLKALRLSPDARHCLVCDDSSLYSLPLEPLTKSKLYDCFDPNTLEWRLPSTTSLLPHHRRGESIYDFAWWPGMTSEDPGSCCFLVSRRDQPVHLIDACSGAVRCSYRMHNHVDEVEAATSVAFNLTGERIYAGCNRMIRIFDVNCQGNSAVSQPTSRTRKHPLGQKGIVSCLAFNPDFCGVISTVVLLSWIKH